MSRSGYTDDCDENWQFVMWRGQVESALRGRRGQQFLRDLIDGLDALPEKVLIANRLQEPETGCVCALGAVGLKRGVALAPLEPAAEDSDGETLGEAFNIARQLALEVEYVNDEGSYRTETPRQRWERVRAWAIDNLTGDLPSSPAKSGDA
jgi:hypothetical protein